MRRRYLRVGVFFVAVLALGLASSGSAAPRAGNSTLSAERAAMARAGLVYPGLVHAPGSQCGDLFAMKSKSGHIIGCTHGPDPATPGINVLPRQTVKQLRARAKPVRIKG